MLKRTIPLIAVAALIGATACERREETRIETPAVETTPAPVAEPQPLTTDTMLLPEDTLMPVPPDTI